MAPLLAAALFSSTALATVLGVHPRAAPFGSNETLVTSEALQASIDPQVLQQRAEALYEIAQASIEEYDHPTRVIGSKGHQGTLDYIYSELSKFGDYFTLSNQTFEAYTGQIEDARLVIGNTTLANATTFDLSPPTIDNKPVEGKLVLVANEGCDAADYPSTLANNIALIKRGTCPFGTKSDFAGKAGALAAVVYNNVEGPLDGTLGTPTPDNVATFGISPEEAAPFLDALNKNATLATTALVDGEVRIIETSNILAQTTQGDADNCIMLGAHSDSVAEGPGINDDGTGTLSLIEVASQLTKFKVNNCVRFGWWSAEETGLLGSEHYTTNLTPEENQKIRLYMNYDMIASPNFVYQVYNSTNSENPEGSEQVRDLYTSWYEANNLQWRYIVFDGRSDYDGFIRNGIPAGGIMTGAEEVKTEEEQQVFGGTTGDWYDPCYHKLCDDVSNVNMTAWEINTKLIAHSVATYALSLDGFPERTPPSNSTETLRFIGQPAVQQAHGCNSHSHEPKFLS